MPNSKILVALTPEATESLKKHAIYGIIADKDTGYIFCDKTEQNGMFIDLYITVNIAELKMTNASVEFSIPSHFVLYSVLGSSDKILGFGKNLQVDDIENDEHSHS